MTNSKTSTIEQYKDYPVEELNKLYQELINSKFCYATKQDQMKHDVEESIYTNNSISFNINTGTFQITDPSYVIMVSELTNLIQKKGGQVIPVNKSEFYYNINELIDYLINEISYPFWNKKFKEFFDSLDNKVLDHITTDEIRNVIRTTLSDKSDIEKDDMIHKYEQLYKIQMLLRLSNSSNKSLFQDFCKEITETTDNNATFIKYNNMTSKKTIDKPY